jgi:site-specific recombinase XerD
VLAPPVPGCRPGPGVDARLRVLGRSDRTLDWYRQKLEVYFAKAGAESLEDFTACEVKRYIVELQEQNLAANTVHGCFQVLRSLANWADAQGYQVSGELRQGFRSRRRPHPETTNGASANAHAERWIR